MVAVHRDPKLQAQHGKAALAKLGLVCSATPAAPSLAAEGGTVAGAAALVASSLVGWWVVSDEEKAAAERELLLRAALLRWWEFRVARRLAKARTLVQQLVALEAPPSCVERAVRSAPRGSSHCSRSIRGRQLATPPPAARHLRSVSTPGGYRWVCTRCRSLCNADRRRSWRGCWLGPARRLSDWIAGWRDTPVGWRCPHAAVRGDCSRLATCGRECGWVRG